LWSFLLNLLPAALYVVGFVAIGLTGFLAAMFAASHIASRSNKVVNWAQWVDFQDKSLIEKYGNRRVAIADFIDDYISKRVSLKVDVRSLFTKHRNDLFKFSFTLNHMKFVLQTLLPQGMTHDQRMDVGEVKWVYDRGNDFYRAFLGPMMIYTSAIFKSYDETLEEAQRNKLDLVCEKIQLKHKEKMLDIGCGWGTLGIHASKFFNAEVTGVSISKEQLEWARHKAKEAGASSVEYKLMDYRDIPKTKYNKITCLEMAEHVGVKNFPAFMKQVYDMLEDDGIFYLQIAGLRRAWQFEDLVWGVFMGTWIFPAADASLPLAWTVNQLECAGFEVQSHENIGIHYSETISRWLANCERNKDKIIAKYGEKWYRIWLVFLAWSVVIAAQGSSTCHMIIAYKNKDAFNRKRFVGGMAEGAPHSRAVPTKRNPVLFPSDKFGSF
jgi:cyclopropane fatty-acyl-phospholipid synthase-like methyltransferase